MSRYYIAELCTEILLFRLDIGVGLGNKCTPPTVPISPTRFFKVILSSSWLSSFALGHQLRHQFLVVRKSPEHKMEYMFKYTIMRPHNVSNFISSSN